jgi:hydroxymethylglutaryl-CoA lyase
VSSAERVTIYEVGPRDGLQNVPDVVPVAVKAAFVHDLAAAGLEAIEVSSFVSPKWVPQLADAEALLARLERRPGVRYPVLVPNERGLDRALGAGAREVAVFTAASEAFNQRNVNAGFEESIRRFEPVARRALAEGLWLRGYVSTAFGCPFQGEVAVDDVLRVVELLLGLGCEEVSIGDTIGVADPAQVAGLVDAIERRFGLGRIALHLHDTWGRGLANCLAGLEAGVRTFDASAGGLGGCPYAPGATGNLATEDLVATLDRLGFETGVDVDRVAAASEALQRATGLPLPSRALAALRAARGPDAGEA